MYLLTLNIWCIFWHCSSDVSSGTAVLVYLLTLQFWCIFWHCSSGVSSNTAVLVYLVTLQFRCIFWHCSWGGRGRQRPLYSVHWSTLKTEQYTLQTLHCTILYSPVHSRPCNYLHCTVPIVVDCWTLMYGRAGLEIAHRTLHTNCKHTGSLHTALPL